MRRTLDIFRPTPHPFGVQNIDVSTDDQFILATYGFASSLFSLEGTLQYQVEEIKARLLPDQSGFVTAWGRAIQRDQSTPDGPPS